MTRPSRLRRTIAAALAALVLTATGASAATAADTGSNWWYDAYGMDAIHQAGWTGKGVKIAVIDSNINPDLPVFSGQNLTVATPALCQEATSPTSGETRKTVIHGTTVVAEIIGNGRGAGAIRGIAPDASVTFYSLGASEDEMPCTTTQSALNGVSWGVQRAIDDGAQIVTTSVGDAIDDNVLANAIAKGVVVVYANPNPDGAASSANEGSTYQIKNGVVLVSPVDQKGDLPQTKTGTTWIVPSTTVTAPGLGVVSVGAKGGSWDASETLQGSSFAAPLVAGALADVKQKYPRTTGNQLVQTLIHNTGKDDHALVDQPASGYGYGLLWPDHMLREDPTQYPDENPLLDRANGHPTAAQITAAAQRGSSYPPTKSTASTSPPEGTGPAQASVAEGMIPLVIAVSIVLALVVIGGVITIVVVIAQKKRRHAGGTS